MERSKLERAAPAHRKRIVGRGAARLWPGWLPLWAAVACGPEHEHACDEDKACFGDNTCLGPAELVHTDIAPLHFVAADVDGDEAVDVLAIGVRQDGSVAAELHRGLGDGTFVEPEESDATGCSAYPLGGDLDGDGAADLVYPDCDGSLLVFWGAPAGPGAASAMVAIPFIMTGSALADFDADGITDLVVVGADPVGAAQLGWVRGSSDRQLALVSSSALTGLPYAPTAVRTGDANGDGTPDALAFAPGVADGLAIMAGQVGGGFAAAQPMTIGARVGQIAIGAFATATAAADVVIAAPQDMRLVVAQIGGGAAAPTPVFPYRPALATPVEWDGEAGDEILVIDGVDPEVRWFRFESDGAAHEDTRFTTPFAAQLVLVPDLDGDGTPDVLVGHLAQGAFSVRLSTHGG